jgi:hypothetical protein
VGKFHFEGGESFAFHPPRNEKLQTAIDRRYRRVRFDDDDEDEDEDEDEDA